MHILNRACHWSIDVSMFVLIQQTKYYSIMTSASGRKSNEQTHATQANKCRLTKHILANMNVRRHSYIGEVVALIQTSSTDPLCNLTVKKS